MLYFLHTVEIKKIKNMLNEEIKNKNIVSFDNCENIILDGNHRVATYLIKNPSIDHINILNHIRDNFNVIDYCNLITYDNEMGVIIKEHLSKYYIKEYIRPIDNKIIKLDTQMLYEDLLCDTLFVSDEHYIPIPIKAEYDINLLRKITHKLRDAYEINRIKSIITIEKISIDEFRKIVNSLMSNNKKFVLQLYPYLNYTHPAEYLILQKNDNKYEIIHTGNGCMRDLNIKKMESPTLSDDMIDFLYKKYVNSNYEHSIEIYSDGLYIVST